MASVPTPIPKTLVRIARSVAAGSPFDSAWKVLVTLVLLAVSAAVAIISPVLGGVVLVTTAGYIIGPSLRNIVDDLYSRDFWSFTVPIRRFVGWLKPW